MCEPRLGYGRTILDAFDHSGLQPNIVADCDSAESLKYMILSGAGIGILPRIAAENEIRAGLFRAIRFEPAQSVGVQLVRRTDVSPLWPQWVTQGLEQLVRGLIDEPKDDGIMPAPESPKKAVQMAKPAQSPSLGR